MISSNVPTEKSGEQTGDEGCLSLPGKAGTVTRPNYVKARAFDENMEEYEIEGTELMARAICHELDHLDGHMYTIMKRMTSLSIILMVPTLIASFYGMNVPIYMEDMPHGFVVIILLSILLSATAFFIFRKIKWF